MAPNRTAAGMLHRGTGLPRPWCPGEGDPLWSCSCLPRTPSVACAIVGCLFLGSLDEAARDVRVLNCSAPEMSERMAEPQLTPQKRKSSTQGDGAPLNSSSKLDKSPAPASVPLVLFR